MSYVHLSLSTLFAALLAAGCAGNPAVGKSQTASGSGDCAQLATDIAAAEEAKRAALEKQQDAWKAVIPFAVAARYASAKSAIGDAHKHLAQLDAEWVQQDCARNAN